MVEDFRGGIANIERNAEKRPVLRIAVHAPAQGLGIFERSQRPIDLADHFAQRDFLRRPLELVAAIRAAEAIHDARPLEVQENRL